MNDRLLANVTMKGTFEMNRYELVRFYPNNKLSSLFSKKGLGLLWTGVLSSSPMALTFPCIVLFNLNQGLAVWGFSVLSHVLLKGDSGLVRSFKNHLQVWSKSSPAFHAEDRAARRAAFLFPQTEPSSYIKFINSWQERNPPIGRNRCSTSNFCHILCS